MEARTKIWLEHDGKLVLSDYRARLLRSVQHSGSLAGAAAEMGLSYRRAWGKVRELEENLDIALVHSDAGGPGGGRSSLTDAGMELLRRYECFADELRTSARALQRQHLDGFLIDRFLRAASRQHGEEIQPIAGDAVDAP